MLKGILPKIISSDIQTKFIVFEGKQNLEKQLERRLRLWQVPNSVFLIMRDQDSGDCKTIKNNLLDKVKNSRKESSTLVRIACHELESFYLGDLDAIEKGLSINGLSKQQLKSKYRNPDNLSNASEELYRLTKNKYQKISGSREIGPHLKTDGTNKSKSFNILIKGIMRLAKWSQNI